MFLDMPYFMENSDWFYFDFQEQKYKLTEFAPERAQKSYKEYYNALNYETSKGEDYVQHHPQILRRR